MVSVDAQFFLRKRYLVILCIGLTYMVLSLMIANFVLFMAKMSAIQSDQAQNGTHVRANDLHWTPLQTGMMMSSMAVGGLFSPLGGILVTKIGGAKCFSGSILGFGVISIQNSILMKQQLLIIMLACFVKGLFGGIMVASQGAILYHWSPPGEKTFLANMSFIGFSLGLIIGYPIAGYFQQVLQWETSFFITGSIAVTWSILLFILIGESPATDKFISKVERDYFKQFDMTVAKAKTQVVHPWREIITSVPLWALLNETFVEAWSTSLVAMGLPLFFRHVHHVSIQDLGWIISIPHYFLVLGKIPAALLADYLRKTKKRSLTTVHKGYILVGNTGAFTLLVFAGLFNNFHLSIIIFCLYRIFNTLAFTSYSILPIDIGAQHGSLIFGLCSTSGGIAYILSHLAMGFMTKNNTFFEWSRYFFILASFNAWAAVIFAFFGSGELQPWARPKEDPREEPENQTVAAHA